MMRLINIVLFGLMIVLESATDWISTAIRRFNPQNRLEKIYSVSVVVGSPECNANCGFCGGQSLRKDALSSNDGTIKGLKSALALCHKYGGWAVSLTGSGEPTLSPEAVTKTLEEINRLENKGIVFPFINLFTNGIELVNNPKMQEHYLPLWKELGLTTVAISIQDAELEKNKRGYNVADDVNFPELKDIVQVVLKAGLMPRVTLLLNKGYCDNVNDYIRNLNTLKDMGVSMVTSWPLCQPNGKKNKYTPDRWELFKIRFFLWNHCPRIFNQVWGGGVYNYHGLSVRLTTYVSEHKPTNDFIRQLVVYQNGTVAYSWYQEGAFCLK